MIRVGDTLSNGLLVKETSLIKDGIATVVLDDNTERVYISDARLEAYCPNDIEIDENLADIADLEAILKWYDIEEHLGEYHYKRIKHNAIAEQCKLEVMLPDGTTQRWSAICDGDGYIEQITTSDGKTLKTLAELRATGIYEAALLSEYDIIDF